MHRAERHGGGGNGRVGRGEHRATGRRAVTASGWAWASRVGEPGWAWAWPSRASAQTAAGRHGVQPC